jgi:hypothetical protein
MSSCHQDLSTYLDGDLSCGDGGERAEESEERARQHTVQMLHRVDVRGLIDSIQYTPKTGGFRLDNQMDGAAGLRAPDLAGEGYYSGAQSGKNVWTIID